MKRLVVLMAICALVVLGGCGGEHDGDDDHEGHDHSTHQEEKGHDDHDEHDEEKGNDDRDDHEGHDHGEHDDEDGESGVHVELTPSERRRVRLEIAVSGAGVVESSAVFPGEVTLDPDRLVHVVPRAAGIVREVTKKIGDRVEAGEVLAWIESDELAETKLDFYAALSEVGCCEIEVPRTKAIFENTARLLTLLGKEANEEELHKLDGLEMGEYRGRLLTAYAEYRAAKETRDREQSLREKNIASGQDLLEAETAHRKAREEFHAAVDMARYETLIAYGEAVRERQVAEFEAVAAEQRLRLRGASDARVEKLRALVPRTASLQPCLCDDPNCEDDKLPSVLDTLGKDKNFARYALLSPSSGFIVKKHIVLGEMVGGEDAVFNVADIESVWVTFSVYQKDLARVSPGQKVRIELDNGGGVREGSVAYLSPVIDEHTRTVPARVVLDNKDGALRPGLFVAVRVDVTTVEAPVVVPKSAVQVLDEEEVIFVADEDGFNAVPVKLGASDGSRVAITSGLRPGQKYVAKGGFDLKAKVVASAMDPHAGHGH